MQKMFPEYEWGPKILTHDRTNNEEINLLGWVFRLSIEIINVHINLSSTNLHRFCILTKTEFYNSHCPHTRKDVHILQIGKKSCNNMKKVFDDILLQAVPVIRFVGVFTLGCEITREVNKRFLHSFKWVFNFNRMLKCNKSEITRREGSDIWK